MQDTPHRSARTPHNKTERKPKRPPRLDEAAVKKAGLHYLERYAASADMLTKVLLRRIDRAERRGATVDRDAAERTIQQVVARFTEAGLIDDKDFATAKIQSFRRRGESTRAIRAKLAQKGVDTALIDAVLAAAKEEYSSDGEELPDPDLEAAFAYARRRRLGPYRPSDVRDGFREKDLAALARKGFSFDICRTVIDMEDEVV